MKNTKVSFQSGFFRARLANLIDGPIDKNLRLEQVGNTLFFHPAKLKFGCRPPN